MHVFIFYLLYFLQSLGEFDTYFWDHSDPPPYVCSGTDVSFEALQSHVRGL